MRKQVPAGRTTTGRDTSYTIVRTQDGRTFRVPEHKAKRFAERIEGRCRDAQRHAARSLTRNQWDASPYEDAPAPRTPRAGRTPR
jgi:hypothetical protein